MVVTKCSAATHICGGVVPRSLDCQWKLPLLALCSGRIRAFTPTLLCLIVSVCFHSFLRGMRPDHCSVVHVRACMVVLNSVSLSWVVLNVTHFV
ncbi:hypothetical protein MPTK1_4g04800 [Marchantia polymorpha subsp. ruderalis]|uniref:Uncharacterized protein n=2 Tax=Marchantia polymorpha TaxID=3197 RepID=A0AAF6B6F6_MARPO|nr:hypothetical protein MARPO_0150s0005 [Marchantia polymorpha]BBN07590.1 hypothetical protein Mp_4g04800 [Marchantia polymorpha subsp. ruderalis]|eukprot:PTQ28982.1 hypothetical protein MARPO_0150s0005 [Marchantia polymorpha]